MDRIALDSQCFTYIVDSWSAVEAPFGAQAEEQVALFRLYTYTPVCFYVTAAARAECARIPEFERAAQHNSFLSTLFQPIPLLAPETVRDLSTHFSQWHSGRVDCEILAETSIAELDVLLSYDSKLLRRLAPH